MDETSGAEPPDAAFLRHLQDGNIRLQRCDECQRQIFPPRVLCPRCGSTALQWRDVDPHGSVYSATTVRQRPDRGGDYGLAIVSLDEGARMLSRVLDVEPAQVRIGDRVVATITSLDDGPAIGFVADTEETP